jgi:hypothetical protein
LVGRGVSCAFSGSSLIDIFDVEQVSRAYSRFECIAEKILLNGRVQPMAVVYFGNHIRSTTFYELLGFSTVFVVGRNNRFPFG